jgi:hydrogenase-4 component B
MTTYVLIASAVSIVVPVSIALVTLLAGRTNLASTPFGLTGLVAGALANAAWISATLLHGSPRMGYLATGALGASFSFGSDALTASLAAPHTLVFPLAGIYALGFLGTTAKSAAGGPNRATRVGANGRTAFWVLINLLFASLNGILLARDGLTLLIAWEAMSITSFGLVVLEADDGEAQRAGWVYLIATQISAAFLMATIFLFARQTGVLDYDGWALDPLTGETLVAALVCGLIAFGLKAGFAPLHVALPDADARATSPVGAVLSATLVNMGLYGLLRLLMIVGRPPLWWSMTLLALGIVSAVYGITQAMAQSTLARSLAFSTVENVGLIMVGFGFGLLGVDSADARLATLGFAGGFLHLWNHSVFKGLMFFVSGAMRRSTGTDNAGRLGGLLNRLPTVGLFAIIGAASICALPPFIGFSGEFLLYSAAFHGTIKLPFPTDVPLMLAAAAMGLVGGLSIVTFARSIGLGWLGAPRTPEAKGALPLPLTMVIPMGVLAAICAVAGLGAPLLIEALGPVVLQMVARMGIADSARATVSLDLVLAPLTNLSISIGVFLVLIGLVAAVRGQLFRHKEVRQGPTWDCGYARPDASMQYTPMGFAEPATSVFEQIVPATVESTPVEGLFPRTAASASHFVDRFFDHVWKPFLTFLTRALDPVARVQSGFVRIYVLYIVVTLVALLTWKLN